MQVNVCFHHSFIILPEQDLTDKNITLFIRLDFLHNSFILYKIPPFKADRLPFCRQDQWVLNLKFHRGK